MSKSKIGISFALFFFSSSLAMAEDLVVTFINQTGETHRGCVAYGYRSNGSKAASGIHPVPANGSFDFNLGECSQFKQWRFVASIDYSDKPENADVVLVDTGQRPVTKCRYSITGTKQ